MPGLGTSLGRGGATTFVQDLQNADCILIEGSNFAECHPVAFRFVMKAKERGATIIHVDPRFTRTSALADRYVPLRSGTDIVFLGAIVNEILRSERYFRDYVVAYTNASSIVGEAFADTEDLGGLFSGWNDEQGAYDSLTWAFETDEYGMPRRDDTLSHPRCVLQILKRHFARYTPEMVERVCGTTREAFTAVCDALIANSGSERTSAIAYAVGWTQHTVGVQYIRTASILQLLLGNIGRPGGGIMALRGHANIQGATDIATLYDLLPGYLPMPSLQRDEQTLDAYLRLNTKRTGWWANTPKYVISLLKAYYGDAATAQNDYCYAYLPQLTGDHSILPTTFAMKDGTVKGYFVIGQNPAVSSQNGELFRAAMERLEWLVNVDSYENETCSFWNREGANPATIATECFFIPAATILEKDGTMVNTNRLLQWHDKAIEPRGESRSDLWFLYKLGKRLKELYSGSSDPKDRPILDMTWEYEHGEERERARGEPSALRVLQEINGVDLRSGELLESFTQCRDDGTTACGGWIYSGVTPDRATNRARSRTADDRTSLQWGFAWPANRRMLYNRASADPGGKPWSERKKYVWWDDARAQWTGADVPDFPKEKAPDTPADPSRGGMEAHSGSDPFIMQLDGRGQIFVAGGLKDGPLPAHYEPLASVLENQLYAQQHNPALREWPRADNSYNAATDEYPYVLTTYRLTEASGIMTRYVPWLAELQPEAFCEIDPELAVTKAIRSGDWVTIRTALGETQARALVSGRLKPVIVGAGAARRRVHQIGLPYNFGSFGFARGDSPNDLVALSMDPNASIHEAKTLTCDLRPGRRPPRTTGAVDRDVAADQRTVFGESIAHGRD